MLSRGQHFAFHTVIRLVPVKPIVNKQSNNTFLLGRRSPFSYALSAGNGSGLNTIRSPYDIRSTVVPGSRNINVDKHVDRAG